MQYVSIILRSVLIVTLFSTIVYGISNSKNFDPVEQTIEAVQECMESGPVPWLDEWKQEYIEAIRKEVDLHRGVTHFDLRLEILRRGFVPYWQSFKKNNERSLFEVHCARIRWYTEHLMGSEFPTEKERQKLSDQYKDIWNYATNSLLSQFPFLDPNAVRNANQEDLSVCYSKIEAPLMPVYLRPFSEEQVEQIKQRWDKLRYARVALWRKLDNDSKTPSENNNSPPSGKELDYELTKESLSQLLGLVWRVVPQRTNYYLDAMNNRTKALKYRVQVKRQARSDQQRLQKERSRQLFQTEHIGFLLTALLETPLCLQWNGSIITREQSQLEQQDKTMKGGGAYEVGTVSNEK